MRRLIEVFLWGCALLAAIQLPGVTLEYVIRHNGGPPATRVVVLAVTVLLARRIGSGSWPRGLRPLGAAAVALTLAAVSAQWTSVSMKHHVAEVSDVGILVPAPGRRYTDCRGLPRRCHEHVLNDLGFRGSLSHRETPDTKLVAFIGDSYVFGSGVGDQDTVPAVVARSLSDLHPPVAVVNAGIPGLNGGSFPGIISYVVKRLRPDIIVVLLKDDDLDDTDVLSRWDRFRRSFGYRMLYVTGFESIYETGRQLWQHWFDRRDRGAVLQQYLNGIATATAGAKLLVVGELADDLRPAFSEWMTAHPGVVHTSAWNDPRIWQAEKIPHDGHWDEAGCAEIAGIVAPLIRRQIAARASAR